MNEIQTFADVLETTVNRAIKEIAYLREQNAYLKKRLAIAEKYMPSEWLDEDDLI